MRPLLFVLLAAPFAGAAQVTTNPSLPTKNIPNQTIKTMGVIKGADLTVSITSFDYTEGGWLIGYTVKNTGTEPVDLKKVTMQSNVSDSDGRLIKPAGGVALLYEGILNPGQEYKSKMGCGEDKIFSNWTYKYKLKVDELNTIPETNENNNIAEYSFTGKKDANLQLTGVRVEQTGNRKTVIQKNTTTSAPPAPAPASSGQTAPPPAKAMCDLVITAGSMTRKSDGSYEVQFTIRNIGVAAAELSSNGIRMYGRVREEDGFEKMASYPTVNYSGKTIPPGETVVGYYTVSSQHMSLLNYGTQYAYYLTVDSIKDIAEGREDNNDFRINIRAGY